MSCINHRLQLSRIKTMKEELVQLQTSIATRKISIEEFVKQKNAIKTKFNTILTYLDIHQSDFYKLGAILRERLNLKYVGEFKNGSTHIYTWYDAQFHIDIRGKHVPPQPKQKNTISIQAYKPKIVRKNGRKHFITEDGSKLNSEEYDDAQDFNNRRAAVEVGKKWHFIKEDGTRLNNENYNNAQGFSNGRAAVEVGKKWHFIKEDGTKLDSEEYSYIEPFSNGRARVKEKNKWYFIKEDGTRLNSEKYTVAEPFSSGRARVKIYGKEFYIDINGKKIEKK